MISDAIYILESIDSSKIDGLLLVQMNKWVGEEIDKEKEPTGYCFRYLALWESFAAYVASLTCY